MFFILLNSYIHQLPWNLHINPRKYCRSFYSRFCPSYQTKNTLLVFARSNRHDTALYQVVHPRTHVISIVSLMDDSMVPNTLHQQDYAFKGFKLHNSQCGHGHHRWHWVIYICIFFFFPPFLCSHKVWLWLPSLLPSGSDVEEEHDRRSVCESTFDKV